MASYYRGVITTGQLSSAGLFQTRGFATELQEAVAADEQGNTAARQKFDPKETGTIEMVLDTSATTFDGLVTAVQAQGTAATPVQITIGTTAYGVDSLNTNETNREFKRASVTASRFTKNGIV
jgi:hypothetical protein